MIDTWLPLLLALLVVVIGNMLLFGWRGDDFRMLDNQPTESSRQIKARAERAKSSTRLFAILCGWLMRP